MSVTLVIPWKHVQHDNHRLMPARPRTGQYAARLITAPEYRQAKLAAEYLIKHQWKGQKRLNGPISLTARCFFPDKRKRDAGNYRKLLTDAMSSICYDDDSQLEDERWIRAGIDKLNPRIEISVAAIEADSQDPAPKRYAASPVEMVQGRILGKADGKTPRKRLGNQ